MKKLIHLLGILALMLAVVACQNDDKLQEPEGVSFSEIDSAPEKLVPKETLPQWLIDRIDGLDDGFIGIKIWKGEWKERDVYIIGCSICSSYFIHFENGENIWNIYEYVDYADDFHSQSKNWVLIYHVKGRFPW